MVDAIPGIITWVISFILVLVVTFIFNKYVYKDLEKKKKIVLTILVFVVSLFIFLILSNLVLQTIYYKPMID